MKRILLVLCMALFVMSGIAQPPDQSFIKGKIKYEFNFESAKHDSLWVELMIGDSLVQQTWARNMKFRFDNVQAATYSIWVKIPKGHRYEQDGVIVQLGRDGFALPAFPGLEIFEVNFDGLEPEEADKVRKAQVKFEKQQAKKAR